MQPQRYTLDSTKALRPEPDAMAWNAWMGKLSNVQIAKTSLGHGRWVSTVFLGSDRAENPGDPPVFYETMVVGFPGVPMSENLFIRAAATYEEARVQHAQAVENLEQEVANADGQ